MNDREQAARALAVRAASEGGLTPEETQAFGAWLLDTMASLIFVHADPARDLALRQFAQDAYYTCELSAEGQHMLGQWTLSNLPDLKRRDRRRHQSDQVPGGRRASDRTGYSPIRAVHLAELDRYFGLTEHFATNGCEHQVKPAKACPVTTCRASRAHVAWEAIQGIQD